VLLVFQFISIAMSLMELQIHLSDFLSIVQCGVSYYLLVSFTKDEYMDVWKSKLFVFIIWISLFVFDFRVDIKWIYINVISDSYPNI
jgi:hypothetical protein